MPAAYGEVRILEVAESVAGAQFERIDRPHDQLWSEVTAQIGAPASQKVSPNVSYEDGGKTLVLDVITDFAVNDWISIRGLGFTIFGSAFSDDGSTWTYIPASEGCGAPVGYDRCLTDIRWTLQNPLPSSAPDNVGTMEYVARIK